MWWLPGHPIYLLSALAVGLSYDERRQSWVRVRCVTGTVQRARGRASPVSQSRWCQAGKHTGWMDDGTNEPFGPLFHRVAACLLACLLLRFNNATDGLTDCTEPLSSPPAVLLSIPLAIDGRAGWFPFPTSLYGLFFPRTSRYGFPFLSFLPLSFSIFSRFCLGLLFCFLVSQRSSQGKGVGGWVCGAARRFLGRSNCLMYVRMLRTNETDGRRGGGGGVGLLATSRQHQ
ncbi:uncharacterized protein J3D65DRAFT_240375 [Phyllosticta citribraziliensis]|uniref:Secreted protein n=1 Tax=Phyllosticta citribraziliensis TaxID=989973 RepID=A0ABR1M0S9_9PEZI